MCVRKINNANLYIHYKVLCALILTLFLSFSSFSQNDSIYIDSTFLNKSKINELFDWKYKIGDDFNNLNSSLPYTHWKSEIYLEENENILEESSHQIIWFKKTLLVDSDLVNQQLFFLLGHNGASQIFIDGKYIISFGNPSSQAAEEIPYSPNHDPITFTFNKPGVHTILIRYSNHKYGILKTLFSYPSFGFHFYLGISDPSDSKVFYKHGIFTYGFLIVLGFLLALSVLHFLIYSFYKEQGSNLFYSLFTLSFASFILMHQIQNLSTTPTAIIISKYYVWRIFVLTFYVLLHLVYSIVYLQPPKKLIKYTNLIALVVFILIFLIPQINNFDLMYVVMVTSITASCTLIGIKISKAVKSKQEGVKIIGRGFLLFIYFAGAYFLASKLEVFKFNVDSIMGYVNFFLLAIGTLSIPVSMSIYLAYSFAKTNLNLKQKLQQVETLSAKTIEQERERQRMIESQKDELEIQVKVRTAEVVAQKEELGHKNKEIIDSINYAKRLQDAILPPQRIIDEYFPDNFLLYLPKDIVAGDFYWTHKKGDWNYIAAADSTGHGVPGAMVSIVCSNALAKAIEEFDVITTGEILDKTTGLVLETFSKSGEEIKDGMDISLLAVNSLTGKVMWSGAHNPLWRFNSLGIHEIKADKQPIGKSDHRKAFTTHELTIEKDTLYILMTDGYADQFGGSAGKKFKYKQLSDMLIESHKLPMKEIKKSLTERFLTWKNNLEQVDDVCIIGIRF